MPLKLQGSRGAVRCRSSAIHFERDSIDSRIRGPLALSAVRLLSELQLPFTSKRLQNRVAEFTDCQLCLLTSALRGPAAWRQLPRAGQGAASCSRWWERHWPAAAVPGGEGSTARVVPATTSWSDVATARWTTEVDIPRRPTPTARRRWRQPSSVVHARSLAGRGRQGGAVAGEDLRASTKARASSEDLELGDQRGGAAA